MKDNKQTYVWGIPTRMFHWLLLISLVGAYIAEEENLTVHVALGYSAGILVVFRFLWGIIGPRYSHFSDFPIGFKSIIEFTRRIGKSDSQYAGHNPPASLIMLGILAMVIIVALTGSATLAQEGGMGILKSFNLPANVEFKEIHEVSVQILIGMVIIHLSGIMLDLFLHKSNSALKSMFTGYKTGVSTEDIKLNVFQKLFAFGWLLAPAIAFYLTITGPAVQLDENESKSKSTKLKDNKGDSEKSDDDDD